MRKFCSSTLRWAFSICFESIFASIGSSLPSSSVGAEAVEDLVDAVAGEQAHEVVLGGEEEARLAGVALAAGAAAQLVVDAARLVALGAADEQAAGLQDLLAVLLDARLDRRAARRRSARRSPGRRARGRAWRARARSRCSALPPSLMSTPRPAMFVAIVTAPGWPASATISPSRSACSGLAFRTVCGMPRLRRLLAEQLGDLDGDRADEHRLAVLVALGDLARRPRCHLPSLVL